MTETISRLQKMPKITAKLCRFYDVTPADLRGPSRKANIAECRHVLMYLLKEVYHKSPRQVAASFNRERSTTYNAIRSVSNYMDVSARFNRQINEWITQEKELK